MVWIADEFQRVCRNIVSDGLRGAGAISRDVKEEASRVACAPKEASPVRDAVRLSDVVERGNPPIVDEYWSKNLPPAATAINPQIAEQFGAPVARLMALSPRISGRFRVLERQNWVACYGDVGEGSFVDREIKTIVIDGEHQGDPLETVKVLFHEIGHAAYRLPPEIPADGLSPETWRAANVRRDLDDEGQASLTQIAGLREIASFGGPHMTASGNCGPECEQIYDRYNRGFSTRQEAARQIGMLYANEINSVTGEKYSDYFANFY